MRKVILKFKVKQLTLDLIFYTIVFILAYFYNKWFEMLVYILAYTFIRSEFSKAIHGKDFTDSSYKGIKYCRYITFSVQIISLIFIINVDLSKYINLILAFILGIINFFAKDYLEVSILNKHYEKKIKEFNSKPLETLTIEEMKKLMPNVRYDRLEIVYQFIHKPKDMRMDIFLDKNFISKATLYRYVNEVQEEYEKIMREN